MKPVLKRVESKGLWHLLHDGKRAEGQCSGLRGDCSGLWGDCSGLRGNCSGLRGDCSGLRGDCSGLRGDCSGLRGDLGDAGLTIEERERGIDIQFLVAKAGA
jgi:hypothetical protein